LGTKISEKKNSKKNKNAKGAPELLLPIFFGVFLTKDFSEKKIKKYSKNYIVKPPNVHLTGYLQYPKHLFHSCARVSFFFLSFFSSSGTRHGVGNIP